MKLKQTTVVRISTEAYLLAAEHAEKLSSKFDIRVTTAEAIADLIRQGTKNEN